MNDWHEAIGRQARAFDGSGSIYAEGTVVALATAPQVLILTPEGQRMWWRADMTLPATECICCEEPLVDGRCAECDGCLGNEVEGLTEDGQDNTCTHASATGVDTAPVGPGKVWACDHCGLRWTDRRSS